MSKFKKQLLGSLDYSFPFNNGDGSCFYISGIVKTDFAGPLRYDVSAKIQFQHLFWLGSIYRKDDALGTGFGLNITKNLLFGYWYEWGNRRQLSSYSKGSHEICIKVMKS